MIISLIATWLKRLGAVCFAFVIIWHLVPHAAPRPGRAIVHLASTDGVMVVVDRHLYRVQSDAETPLVCDLAPGPHVVQVWRHGSKEAEKRFTIEPGRVVVVRPFDRPTYASRAEGVRTEPLAAAASPAGLAVRLRQPMPTSATN